MSQNDNMPDPSNPPENQPAEPGKPDKKPKRKRRWLRGLLVLMVLLIALVALAPMIISTGPVRSLVTGQVNNYINGTVEIADWSIGWNSGIHVRDVKVKDTAGQTILSAPRIDTDLSLLQAARGKLPLGKVLVNVDDFKMVVDENGNNNFSKLLKPSNKKPSSEETRLPDITADVLVNLHGTVQQAGKPTLTLDKGTVTAKVTDINQPIDHAVNLAWKIGDQPAGTVNLAGVADAIDQNKVNIQKLVVKDTLKIDGFDLAGLKPLLPSMPQLEKLAGVTSGALDVQLSNGTPATLIIIPNIGTTDFQIGGPPVTLASATTQPAPAPAPAPAAAIASVSATTQPTFVETYATRKLDIASTITITFPQGLEKYEEAYVKVGRSAEEPMSIVTDQGKVTLLVDAPLAALMNVAARQAPGQPGTVGFLATFDIAKLAAMMPETFRLRPGIRLDSTQFTQTANITLTKENAAVQAGTRLTDIAATDTTSGKKIAIQPIKLDLSATSWGGQGVVPDVRDLNLDLSSGFASGTITGKTLSEVGGEIKGQFDKMQQELGQIADFGALKLAGAFAVKLQGKGELLKEGDEAPFSITTTLDNVEASGIGTLPPIREPHLISTVSGTLVRGDKDFVRQIKDAILTVRSGDEQAPTVDVHATAALAMNPPAPAGAKNVAPVASTFTVDRFDIDLAKAEQQYAALVPQLKQYQLQVGAGQVQARATGSFDGANLKAEVTQLALRLGNAAAPTLDVQSVATLAVSNALDGDAMTIAAPQFKLSKLSADVPALAKQFGGALPALKEYNITSGTLTGDAAGSYDGKTITLANATFKPQRLTLAGTRLANYSATLDAAGTVRLDPKSIAVALSKLSYTDDAKLLNISKGDQDFTLLMGDGGFSANGQLGLSADVKQAMDIVADLTGKPVELLINGKKGELKSGLLTGTVTAAHANKSSTLNGNLKLASLTIADLAGTQRPLDNETLDIAIEQVVVPDDFSTVNLKTLNVTGLVSAKVADLLLKLPPPQPPQDPKAGATTRPVNVWDLVQKGTIEVNVPSVPKVMTLAQAFMPPSTQPAEPQKPKARPRPVSGGGEAIGRPASGGDVIGRPAPAPSPAPAGSDVIGRPANTDEELLKQFDQPTRRDEPAPNPAPAPAPGEPQQKPLPPLQVTDGSVSLTMNIGRQANKTTLATTLTSEKLALARGEMRYAPQPLNLKANVAIDAQYAPDKSPLQQIAQVVVSSLESQGLATVKLLEPIVVKDPGGQMTAAGKVQLDGQIVPVMDLLAVIQGQRNPASLSGAYTATQTLSTAADGNISVAGGMDVTQLQVQQENKQLFAEDRLHVENDLSLLMKGAGADSTLKLAIRKLAADMQSSQAFRIALSGTVSTQNDEYGLALVRFRGPADKPDAGVSGTFSYNADKLLPLIRPFVDPKTLEGISIKGIEKDRPFVLSGDYDMTVPPAQALAKVNFNTGASLDQVLMSTLGVDIQKLQVPVMLKDGIMTVADPANPTAPVPAAQFNGGTANLGGIALDLRQPSPRLNIPKGTILDKVALNPTFAGKFLGPTLGPLFTNLDLINGSLAVKVVECRDVPLSWLMPGDPNNPRPRTERGGRAEFIVNIPLVDARSPVAQALAQLGDRKEALTMQVKDARIVIENGQIQSDVPVFVDQHKLAITGAFDMPNRHIVNMDMAIPKGLIRNIPGISSISKQLPAVIHAPFAGSLDHPKFSFVDAITKSVTSGLIPGQGGNQGGGGSDPLGDLLKGLGGDNNKDKTNDTSKDKPKKPKK